jgi:hypothetical protein
MLALEKYDRPPQTDSGSTDFRTGRSKPVIELCKSNVSYVAMISTIAAPATNQ